ncbi:hypothetical protein HMPREF3037_02005 [Candidatus Stoquefichus sp. KLE1796]|nr:hypothetical protein HMPREF3037_02005 [Candidatus Stoquefichus sp. KLE1796]
MLIHYNPQIQYKDFKYVAFDNVFFYNKDIKEGGIWNRYMELL